MKKRTLFSVASLTMVASVWACWSIAQDPNELIVRTEGRPAIVDVTGPADTVNVVGSLATSPAYPAASAYTFHSTQAYGAGNAEAQADMVLEREVLSLVKKYADSKDDSAKAQIAKQLADVVGKQFDIRQEARQQELKKLEEQLARLRDVQAKRTALRDRIIGDRVQQIVREADGLGWGASDQSPGWSNSSYGFGNTRAVWFGDSAPASTASPLFRAPEPAASSGVAPTATTTITAPAARP